MYSSDESSQELELSILFGRNARWIRARVRRRLGRHLRSQFQSCDIEQEALLRYVRMGGSGAVQSDLDFRRLMARIVENVIRDQHDWMFAEARHPGREAANDGSRPLVADCTAETDTPSQHAMRHEQEKVVQYALDLMRPEDRELIHLRRWQEMPFKEIAARGGRSVSAVESQYRRAMRELGRLVGHLRDGEWPQVVAAARLDG